jgi:hypothetical protein
MSIVRNSPVRLALYLAAATFGVWLSMEARTPAPLKADAVCSDGWLSDSEGSGTCSHHGGVSRWTPDQDTWSPGVQTPTSDSFRSSSDPDWADMTTKQRAIEVLLTAFGSIVLGAVLAWGIWLYSIAFGGSVAYSTAWVLGSVLAFGINLYQLIH